MNNTNHKSVEQKKALRGTALNLIRVAALGVLAGGSFSAPVRAADATNTPDAPNQERTTSALDDVTTPVDEVPTPPTTPGDVVADVDPTPIVTIPATKPADAAAPAAPATPAVPAAPAAPAAPATAPIDPKVTSPANPTLVVPDTKPETAKPDAKAQVKPEAKPETKPDATPAAGAPATTAAAAGPTTLPSAPVESKLVSSPLNATGGINLMVNRSSVITTKVAYKQVHIAAPDIAEAVLLDGSKNILVNGKKPGSTQLIIWDSEGNSQSVEVVVGFDLRGLDSQLKEMFPKATIKADIANGTIVLRGHVPDLATAQKAVQVATPYGANAVNGVLNFLEVSGGQQVVLHVRFAEVQRSVKDQLGFNAFVTDGRFTAGFNNAPGGSPIGALATGSSTATIPSSASLFGSARAGDVAFEYFIQALRTNGLLRDLAEPNVIAISGQEASFLAGGEIPIPVPQPGGGSTGITIDYKKYGITLKFTPTVLGDGRVRLHCAPEVSTLDYSNAIEIAGSPVPALVTRNVDTTVELAEGQTFALAGLLDNRVTANNAATPLLGDLPIIGALFRSVSYQRQETELVVLVTPHMVEALNPGQVPSLPGTPWRDPTEAQLYANGDLGGPAPDTKLAPAVRTSRFYGTAGYAPAPSDAHK